MAFNLQKKNEELFIVGQQTSTTDSGAYSLFTAAHKKKFAHDSCASLLNLLNIIKYGMKNIQMECLQPKRSLL